MKITKKGKSITSRENEDFIINTKYPNQFTNNFGRFVYNFSNSSAFPGTEVLLNISHNLGYKPESICYCSEDDFQYRFLPISTYSYKTNGLHPLDPLSWYTYEGIYAYSDENNFYITLEKYYGGNAIPPNDSTAWKDMSGISFYLKYYIYY